MGLQSCIDFHIRSSPRTLEQLHIDGFRTSGQNRRFQNILNLPPRSLIDPRPDVSFGTNRLRFRISFDSIVAMSIENDVPFHQPNRSNSSSFASHKRLHSAFVSVLASSVAAIFPGISHRDGGRLQTEEKLSSRIRVYVCAGGGHLSVLQPPMFITHCSIDETALPSDRSCASAETNQVQILPSQRPFIQDEWGMVDRGQS